MPRDVADAFDIGDGRAAEFHHKAAHFLFIAADGASRLVA
jgi:hypothetical protein